MVTDDGCERGKDPDCCGLAELGGNNPTLKVNIFSFRMSGYKRQINKSKNTQNHDQAQCHQTGDSGRVIFFWLTVGLPGDICKLKVSQSGTRILTNLLLAKLEMTPSLPVRV